MIEANGCGVAVGLAVLEALISLTSAKMEFLRCFAKFVSTSICRRTRKKDIPKRSFAQYKILKQNLKNLEAEDGFLNQLKMFFAILEKLSSGDVSDHFRIDFKRSEILKL